MQHKGGNGVTTQDIQRWETIGEAQRPKDPTPEECLTAPGVQSFTGLCRRDGITLRLAVDDGQQVTLNLNPVVAAALLRELVQAGNRMGWIDSKGQPCRNA